MANDSSISRVTAESNSQVARKKSSPDAIELNRLSFFDELLSIGEFESTLPTPSTLPAPTSSQGSQDSKATGSDDKSDTVRESDQDPDQPASQPVFVAQPQQLAQSADPASKAQSSDESALVKVVSNKPIDQSASNQGIDPNWERVETQQADAIAPRPQADSLTEKATSKLDASTKNTSEASTKSLPIDANDLPKTTAAKEATKRDRDAKGNIANQVANTKETHESSTKTNDAKVERQAKGQEGANLVERQLRDIVNTDGNQPSENQPRSKRADRLAKQATNEEPSTNDQSNPTNTELKDLRAIDSISKDTSFAENVTSLSTATSTSSSPIVNLSSEAAPSAFTLSNSNALTGSAAANASDGKVAAGAIRGGIATGGANSPSASSGNGPVTARAEQSRAEVARPNSGTPITAYQEKKLVQRVLRGVEQLANGGGQVRLRLHPPELGSLQMSLRMEAGQVFAKLEVENSTAKEALLNNVQTLKDRMAEQGMTVSAFEVEVSTDSSGSGTGSSNLPNSNGTGQESRWENARSRFVQQNENRLSSETTVADRKPDLKWIRTNGSLDLTV